jgi:hypothetical protein
MDGLTELCPGKAGREQGLIFNLRIKDVDFFLNVDGPFQGDAAAGRGPWRSYVFTAASVIWRIQDPPHSMSLSVSPVR